MTEHVVGLISSDPLLPPASTVGLMLAALGLRERYGRAIVEDGLAAFGHLSTSDHPARARAGRCHLIGDLDAAYWHDPSTMARPVAESVLDRIARDPQAMPTALAALDGEFSFLRWDAAEARLDMVRDRCGTRGLFYLHRPGRWLAISTLLPGLLIAPLGDAALDRETVAKQGATNYATGERTLFAGVRRVQPGRVVSYRNGRLEARRYWQLACRDPISPRTDPDEVIDALRDTLRGAVARLLPGPGPAFGHLSGGLDSTSVAGLAAEVRASTDDTVRTYSFHPAAPDLVTSDIDERPAIAAVRAAYPNIDHLAVPAEALTALYREPVHPIYPGPAAEARNNAMTALLADAAERGAGRLFSGWGGDEVVSYAGYGAFAELFVKGRWGALWRLARAHGRIVDGRGLFAVAREVRSYVLPRLPGMGRQYVARSAADFAPILRLLRPELRALAVRDNPPAWPDTRRIRAARLESSHIPLMLEELAHRAAPHGLMYVSPLLDRNVLEFAIRLPPEILMLGGWRRAPLRHAMRGILPDPVRLRWNKLVPDTTEAYRMVRARDALQAAVAGLRGGAAEAFFDLDAIAASVAALPDPDALLAEIKAQAARGRQHVGTGYDFVGPLMMARFVARRAEIARGTGPGA